MRIGLDIMGGDFAPVNTIKGAILALDELTPKDVLVLLGDENVIRQELRAAGVCEDLFFIVDEPECIRMEEKPLKALQEKPRAGITAGFRMLAAGEIDAFASAGNSGAMLAGAVRSVQCIPGVVRPCSATTLPQEEGGDCLILDIGTMPDAKPDVLFQFGILGSIYAQYILKKDKPRVCLLNVGTEDGKGNLQCQAAFHLMKNNRFFHFVGNMEPRDLFKNKADVFVTDGFVGNIVIKEIETFYRLIQKRNLSDAFMDRMNYELYGGSPLLGVNAPVILGHGISSALAIKNMIMQTKKMHESRISERLREIFYEYADKKE
ncbi:MAG: phosphate--acyl-ACP acyltransferase [Bacteroidales bacterium]